MQVAGDNRTEAAQGRRGSLEWPRLGVGKAGSQVCADDLLRAPCASQHVFAFDLQDKQTKEQENKGDFLPRPFPQKLEKPLPVHRQPPASLVTQLQSTRALLRDRKATRPGLPDRGGWVRGRRVPRGWLRGPGTDRILCPWESRVSALRPPGSSTIEV